MKGILLKKENGRGIILTRDGAFCKGLIEKDVTLGEEAVVNPPVRKVLSFWLVAAVLLITAAALAVYRMIVPDSWSYVALDIEPSVELSLDKKLIITDLRGFNEQGKRLAAALQELQGKPLATGLEDLLEKALAAGYLREGEDTTVMVTGASKYKDERINAEELARMVAENFPVQRGKAEIVAVCTDTGIRKKAVKANLSTGRYLLQQELRRRGLTVASGILREEPLERFEREYRITLSALVGNKGSVLIRTKDFSLERQNPPAFFASPVPVLEDK
ncbi:MAG: anti-sigma factor domain-containing protein [Firmicutes bacterium]|nr:anti-sigma factor domain-containing protein [Bacillota bacterium]